MATKWEGFDPSALGLSVVTWAGPDEVMCSCPFHGGSDSLCLNVRKGLFICFACGERGHVNKLAAKTGGQVHRTVIKPTNHTTDEWRDQLKGDLAFDHSYLKSRGVTNEQIEKFEIRRCPDGIIIPMYNWEGETVGCLKRRDTPGKLRYVNFGLKPPLWPLNSLKRMKPGAEVAVVEGVFGVLAADRATVPAVATLGAAVKYAATPFLNRYSPLVFFDDDFAGWTGAGRLVRMVARTRVYVHAGVEFDELFPSGWLNAWHQARSSPAAWTTRNLEQMATRSGDRDKFYSLMPRVYHR